MPFVESTQKGKSVSGCGPGRVCVTLCDGSSGIWLAFVMAFPVIGGRDTLTAIFFPHPHSHLICVDLSLFSVTFVMASHPSERGRCWHVKQSGHWLDSPLHLIHHCTLPSACLALIGAFQLGFSLFQPSKRNWVSLVPSHCTMTRPG